MKILPVSPERWNDLQQLFGPRGACGGCWCMWWRLTGSEFDQAKGDANRDAFREMVRSGCSLGLLAYEGDRAIGWCSVEPRESFPRLGRSRVLKPVDEQPVWSIPCFFIDRAHRGQGVAVALLEAAVEYVRSQGGEILEGYPVEPKKGKGRMPELFAFTGVPSLFERAGFKEVARRSETRPIMRRWVGDVGPGL